MSTPMPDRTIAARWPLRRSGIVTASASLLLGGSFLAASPVALAARLLHSSTPRRGSGRSVVFAGSYALASRIDFEIGTGSAVPTQLRPRADARPPSGAVRPALCRSRSAPRRPPEYVRGRVPVDRSLLRLVNSWHAVGPALVLIAAASPHRRRNNLPIYALALVAQFAFDFGSTALHATVSASVSRRGASCVSWSGSGPSTSALTPDLRPRCTRLRRAPHWIVVSLPLIGLLAYFARERQVRIDHALELGTPTEAPRCCSETSSRPTMPTRAATAATWCRS